MTPVRKKEKARRKQTTVLRNTERKKIKPKKIKAKKTGISKAKPVRKKKTGAGNTSFSRTRKKTTARRQTTARGSTGRHRPAKRKHTQALSKKRRKKTGNIRKRNLSVKNNTRSGTKKRGINYKKKRKRRNLLWILWIPAALAGLAACFALWYFSFENLHPQDYINITYSGYDSRGTAVLSIQETEEYAPFLEDAQVRLLTENGNLKNGDLLEISFLYNEETAKEQKLRIKEDSFQIQVSGLPQGKELSPELLFQDVRISYEGIAPKLSPAISNESTDPFLSTVTYEIPDQKNFYDIGDTFTVAAHFSEEDAVSYEYAVSGSDYTKEYIVENTDRYLRDSSQLTPEQFHTLNETASSYFGDATEYGLRIFSEANLMPVWINGKTTFRWSNPRLISAYLNVLKPEYFETSQSHNNDVKLVYMATLSQADGVACDAEVVVQFSDLIQKADGSYDLALDSGRIIAASYRNSHIQDLVTDSYAQEYEAEKLVLN